MRSRSLKDKVIVVTGAGSGLGAALARHFARLGGKVILIDINKEAIDAVAGEVESGGAHYVPECKVVDVVDEHALSDSLAEVKKAHGVLDIIVNNAGILIAGEARDMDLGIFRKILDINLMGVVIGSLVAFKIMALQGQGKIVNISSISGLVSSPLYAAYSMTKHAVTGFSKALREEGRSLGVDVMVICPGTLRTSIFEAGNVVNAPKDQVFKESPLSSISADEAAAKVIDAIYANRCITVFPFYALLMWWFEKIDPSILKPLHERTLKNFRSHRGK